MGSSFSSPNSEKKHDVFLSFRGEDTRNNFLSHLKANLRENGIDPFTDDEQIKTGERISPQLLEAIENSRCSIIIFSPQYASSTWCLVELVKILDCMERKGQIVVPIFYHVARLDVRDQTGIFGEAFAKHKEDSRVQSWRNALTQVADLSGFVLENRNEAEFISEIVELVSSKMSTVLSSNILKSFFGMSSHASRLNSYFSPPLRSFALLLSSFFFVP